MPLRHIIQYRQWLVLLLSWSVYGGIILPGQVVEWFRGQGKVRRNIYRIANPEEQRAPKGLKRAEPLSLYASALSTSSPSIRGLSPSYSNSARYGISEEDYTHQWKLLQPPNSSWTGGVFPPNPPKVGGERTQSCQVRRLALVYRLRGVCDPSSIDFVPIGDIGQDWQLLRVKNWSRIDDSDSSQKKKGRDEPSTL